MPDSRPPRCALYRSVGETLTHFDIDVERAELTPRASINLPGNVQYLWPHPSRKYFYVSSSDGGSASLGVTGKVHRISALRVDANTGALQAHGEPQPLPSRPIHTCVDASGSFVLNAYNHPSNITVHRINANGTVGVEVKPAQPLDTGVFAHQVMMMPSNRAAVLVTRGNDASKDKPEDAGALKLYRFDNGVLSPLASVAPGGRGGLGYGPRHLDFHPTQPWMYVSIERQNTLHMHRIEGDTVSPEPVYSKNTLTDPSNVRPRQMASAVHVHPNGRFVYVANRADGKIEVDGKKVFAGGENSIAVFSIDQKTGEPTLIQHADPQTLHVRTFALDPSARLMVTASINTVPVRDGDNIKQVPATMSVFRVGDDGKLAFVRKYDVPVDSKSQFWMGIVDLHSVA